MPTTIKNVTGTAIIEKVEPLTVSAVIEAGLNVLFVTKALPATPIAPRINPSMVPTRAQMRSCIQTIAQSALPISSANVCADGFVSTLKY